MKQLVQDFKSGAVQVVEVPVPAATRGMVLVRNAFSVVSAGTERMTVATGQASLLEKARQRPELVKQVFANVRREGVAATVRKVQAKLDQWKQLGYATAGTVIEVGDGVTGLAPGDQVACAGQDYASHAEIVCVPQNLCARVPAGVELAHAAFTTLGAIAMQGIRQADVRLGESVAVIGLGLIGQLTVQLLRAAGCRVFGHDPRAEACAGIEPAPPGHVDAAIITASAPSNEPLVLAGELCRDRGRVVLVGVTGMELPRDIYYRKELEFRLSRSYGPGRYDPQYEEHGVDYPVGYVRWTEQRNMQAFLELLAAGKLNLAPLITHTFAIAEATKAYEVVLAKSGVGVVLKYPESGSGPSAATVGAPGPFPRAEVGLGLIGAGSYAQGVLLPLFQASKDVTLATVCNASGVKAEKARAKFGFASATANWRDVIADARINTVVVATRHNLHAEIVTAALRAGKTVFCEKPLCLREDELEQIIQAGSDRLMVGFNRRFAPFAASVRAVPAPKVMRYRVSVPPLPREHWVNDPEIGGGRILGEVCHFVDFLQFAAPSRLVSVFAQGFGGDNVQVSLRFADDSLGAVDYFSVADAALAKEHIEAFGGGQHLFVDDFRDKGQAEEVRQFIAAVKTGGPMPIPFVELVASTRATFAVVRSLQTGQAVAL